MQDVTERKRAEEQIRYLAYHDSLTGLGNRLLFKERLEMAVAQARRNAAGAAACSSSTSTTSSASTTRSATRVGDALLQGVADRLVPSVRETDARGARRDAERDLAARRRRVHDPARRTCRTRRISRRSRAASSSRCAGPSTSRGHEVVISGSIGITAWPDDGDDAEALLRNADTAMYHAKEHGPEQLPVLRRSR